MSYVDQNLMSGESIVYRTRLHWIIFLAPLVVLGFYIMIALDRAVREPGVESRTLNALGLVGLLSLLLMSQETKPLVQQEKLWLSLTKQRTKTSSQPLHQE